METKKKKEEKSAIRRRGLRSDCTFRPVQMCFVHRQMCRTNDTPTTTHRLTAHDEQRVPDSPFLLFAFSFWMWHNTKRRFLPVSGRKRGFQPSLCTSLPWFPCALKTSAPRFVAPIGQLRSLIESCVNASLCYAAAGEMRSFVQPPLLSLSLFLAFPPSLARRPCGKAKRFHGNSAYLWRVNWEGWEVRALTLLYISVWHHANVPSMDFGSNILVKGFILMTTTRQLRWGWGGGHNLNLPDLRDLLSADLAWIQLSAGAYSVLKWYIMQEDAVELFSDLECTNTCIVITFSSDCILSLITVPTRGCFRHDNIYSLQPCIWGARIYSSCLL